MFNACADGVVGGVSDKSFGNMSLSYGDTSRSLENRRIFLEQLGIDHRAIVTAQQAHGSNIHFAVKEDAGRGALSYDAALPDTDGLITAQPGLPLAIFTADCLAVFLYEPEARAIGLIHCGWRGLKLGILSKAVRLMRDEFSAAPARIAAGFGPAIGSCCYEVGEEFRADFPADLEEKEGRLCLDLARAAARQLAACGVEKENISLNDSCTSCRNDRLFSFRREGPSAGRMLSVMMLR
jgi:YfiH family protein